MFSIKISFLEGKKKLKKKLIFLCFVSNEKYKFNQDIINIYIYIYNIYIYIYIYIYKISLNKHI